MRVRWSGKAKTELENTLDFWSENNKSDSYSEKIAIETEKVQKEIEEDPYFLAKYIEEDNVYQRIFFKGRFLLYYEIKGDCVIILRFRSTKQKPLF
ncbi:type II toxin-antitoxin system RelE/ParE family toxin [Capnocytophaga ochracea]|uniref:type II toxin-antitoxin system RelE/ParE family toxin n=1 Tax=Capnocytophaga ochracea TaxID=1018 RepID=UPI00223210C6|nr:type II toxin-antitoxin system RelE/ParE family toxin [Capnocytophaga ochracea]UZD39281.1 type II toxin-antitoxin system RelE/ParE family toxin [Capnocytophaga ochracea]